MAVIDIGAAAIDRTTTWPNGYTTFNLENPANETGSITSVEIYLAEAATATLKITIASRDGAKFTPRDSVTIGTAAAGSKQTFTMDSDSNPIALDVVSGDYIGMYYNPGKIERSSGGSGIYYKSGDQSAAGEQTYTLYSGVISLYATGETASSTSIKLVMGVPIADVKAINGVPIANIKQFNGVSNVS